MPKATNTKLLMATDQQSRLSGVELPSTGRAFLSFCVRHGPGWQALIHDLSVYTHVGSLHGGAWLNNSAAVLQAAIEGHGIALARSVMAHDDVSSGRLIHLFPEIILASELAYYVVYRNECVAFPKVASFRNWLMQEATRFT